METVMGDTYDDYDIAYDSNAKFPQPEWRGIRNANVDELRAEVERLTTDNARLANKLVNDIPGSYLQMKTRALEAEAKLKRLTEYLDHRDVIQKQVFGIPDTVEVVSKVTTDDIREVIK